ncbi:MAG: hypothetical protein JWM11_4837, partial [Planctomycetaceae bacterium]|nr:hypothetical protein [Planctomycetaceae bacterium]
MNEHHQVRSGKWIWSLVGLCGCLLLAFSAKAYFVPVNSVELVIDEPPTAEAPTAKVSETDKPPLGQITVLVPTKKFKKEGPNKAYRVGFDDIDIEKVLNTKELSVDLPSKMPEWLQKLNGQRIRLRGYMHPGSAFQEDGIKRFIFCRDTSACCFGPDPTIYYLITTTMRSGTSTSYHD